jgi:transposase
VEKGGLADALTAAGITVAQGVGWADEMRIGLFGTTRRVWGRRGVKVRQRLQLVREWRYLHLVVDPAGGKLWWFWSQTMQATVARSLVEATRTETDLGAVVWDRAPSHRDATVRAVGLPLIEQPPYAPELNPVERVFEYLRAEIEGIVYPTIEAKVAAVEAILETLDATPQRVQQLTNWQWIVDSLDRLPQTNAA